MRSDITAVYNPYFAPPADYAPRPVRYLPEWRVSVVAKDGSAYPWTPKPAAKPPTPPKAPQSIAVVIHHPDGRELRFASLGKAAKASGVSPTTLSNMLTGKCRSHWSAFTIRYAGGG